MKNIWIIGASSGIGEALANALDQQGYSVGLSARDEEKLNKIAASLKEKHAVHPCDVTEPDQISKAMKAIQKKLGGIDSIIFMAGIYTPMTIDQLDLEATKNIINVNLMGAFNVIQKTLPYLKQQENPQLVLCASVAGYRGLPGGQPYGSTKAALINLAETLRCELRGQVDVKVINPGFVKTRLTDKNNFDMPLRISPEKAAIYIIKGLKKKKFEIHFPKLFTISLKILSYLPETLYTSLVSSQKK